MDRLTARENRTVDDPDRDPKILRVSRIVATWEPRVWQWADENAAAIASHWDALRRERPQLFDGRVLLLSRFAFADDEAIAGYFPTDFSRFLGWRDLDYPDRTVANGFAMGALQGSDGAYVCGVMGGHTANAGRIYFPSGTPDPSDITDDDAVDLAGSVLRELREETDLSPESYRVADHWIVVRHWPAIAFLRPILFDEPAENVAERIRAAIARQRDPELSGAHVMRGFDDVDDSRVPRFLQFFFRHAFA
jgi:8-oxo-dGTP pyrophosphatase MutT (NUDIX family)